MVSPEEASTPTDINITVKDVLTSHIDAVRGIYHLPGSETLVTASEDCTLKIWDLSAQLTIEDTSQLEPYITLRGHTGPLFALTGTKASMPEHHNLVFTSGKEGIVRVWSVPRFQDVTPYGDSKDGLNYCLGVWADGNDGEPIWDLAYNDQLGALISTSADGNTVLWQAHRPKYSDI